MNSNPQHPALDESRPYAPLAVVLVSCRSTRREAERDAHLCADNAGVDAVARARFVRDVLARFDARQRARQEG